MERILLFVKHNLKFLWRIIESGNGMLFRILYKSKKERVSNNVINGMPTDLVLYKELGLSDMPLLIKLIKSQNANDLRYFKPHSFDKRTLITLCRRPDFLMMGAFKDEELIGYFFLRFFFTRKCFVGRLIDKDFRGKGIGADMNYIMYEIAWQIEFRCLATISRNNVAVMRAHAKNPSVLVLKELKDNFLLVEFVRNVSNSKHIRHKSYVQES